jgi:pimeloyl-ACP methyl ester carboxylesterase
MTHPAAGNPPLASHLVPGLAASIRVESCGVGPLVVLLPSVGRGTEDFAALAPSLASRGCRVLLPSPRGIGGSTGSLEGATLYDLAQDVADVIRAERAGPALVAGHAYGNWVARMTAVAHPSLVRGVAVLAAAHRDFPASLRRQIDACMDARLPAPERIAHLQAAFFAPGHDPSGWLDGWHPELARAQRAAAAAVPRERWWHAGQVPVLDVQAELDPFAPRSGALELRRELGEARVRTVLIRDASHALVPEQPQAVIDALIEFLHALPPCRPDASENDKET